MAYFAEQFGDSEAASVAAAYRNSDGNDQCMVADELALICDQIESDWNESLPDDLGASWIDGEFFIATLDDLASR